MFFSPFSSSFSCFVFFFSPSPRVRLKRNTNEKNNYLILFACRGSFRKCPLRKIIVSFFFCWISCCSQNMYWLDIVGLCLEGVRDSWLLAFSCSIVVVVVFGDEPSFCPNFPWFLAFLGFVLFCVCGFVSILLRQHLLLEWTRASIWQSDAIGHHVCWSTCCASHFWSSRLGRPLLLGGCCCSCTCSRSCRDYRMLLLPCANFLNVALSSLLSCQGVIQYYYSHSKTLKSPMVTKTYT